MYYNGNLALLSASRLGIGNRDHQLVLARWNRNGFYYKARGRVVALRSQRVEVALEEIPPLGDLYRRGQVIELPRISDFNAWSSATCVRKMAVGA